MNIKDLEKLCNYLECNDASLEAQQKAAAELRRLHEVNQELLELVGDVLAFVENDWSVPSELINTTRAAIAKATGEQS